MKTLVISAIFATLIASSAYAENVSCTYKAIDGDTASFSLVQDGDSFKGEGTAKVSMEGQAVDLPVTVIASLGLTNGDLSSVLTWSDGIETLTAAVPVTSSGNAIPVYSIGRFSQEGPLFEKAGTLTCLTESQK